jgi:hypothetical protein
VPFFRFFPHERKESAPGGTDKPANPAGVTRAARRPGRGKRHRIPRADTIRPCRALSNVHPVGNGLDRSANGTGIRRAGQDPPLRARTKSRAARIAAYRPAPQKTGGRRGLPPAGKQLSGYSCTSGRRRRRRGSPGLPCPCRTRSTRPDGRCPAAARCACTRGCGASSRA